jgi:DUF2075 family protein
MLNYYYGDSISNFLLKSPDTIVGEISRTGRLGHITTELYAWERQIEILQTCLIDFQGAIYFEFSIPRMGKRVDCLLILQGIVFVIEFKVGAEEYYIHHLDQVWDYALDLKNFHATSHSIPMVPILVATEAPAKAEQRIHVNSEDNLLQPLLANASNLKGLLQMTQEYICTSDYIDPDFYTKGSYSPTPTIIEAAISLFNGNKVEEITRSDAGATNLSVTTEYISALISEAKENEKKIICFVTGVPGAGKTLVGLKVATDHLEKDKDTKSVFLSGNKPLVDILQEALAQDKVRQMREQGEKITLRVARQSVKAFIQIIHHYRDEYLKDEKAPYDHVAIFDEAQRAWTKEQTVKFMEQKKNVRDFDHSEPEYLISCLDRHKDWAVIICLVGGGQEINTGEAGISEWLAAVKNKYTHWETRISPSLLDSEYDAKSAVADLQKNAVVQFAENLHLSVSMRSFRAENLSKLVKEILDFNPNAAETYEKLKEQYPLVITRDLEKAKTWLRSKARGTERYGLVVSSQAYRLKPLAIDVKTKIDHVKWFLNNRDDVRSSYFLEEVATEFQVQGLEMDWVALVWDADLRVKDSRWDHNSFVGSQWQKIRKAERKQYLLNAYRVLMTRARQGMIIVIPEGSAEDHTRLPEFYEGVYRYLSSIGIKEI